MGKREYIPECADCVRERREKLQLRNERIIQKIADKYYWPIKKSDHLVELKEAIREALK